MGLSDTHSFVVRYESSIWKDLSQYRPGIVLRPGRRCNVQRSMYNPWNDRGVLGGV